MTKEKRLWAVRIRYLESEYTGDGKWHTKTTKWYDKSILAWNESDEFLMLHGNVMESSSSLIWKEVK